MLLGMHPTESHAYVYGAITRSGTAFQRTSTSHAISHSAHRRQTMQRTLPQPQPRNPCRVLTRNWFSLLRFRSPLLSESLLFSLPVGTEMFHFPTFPPHTLFHSGAGNTT